MYPAFSKSASHWLNKPPPLKGGLFPSSWNIYYNYDETCGMLSAIGQGVGKNNKLCSNFWWEYVSIMWKTNWIMQRNFNT